MKTNKKFKNTRISLNSRILIFGLLCLSLCAMGDDCSGVGTPPPPVFGLVYTTGNVNNTKFSFNPSQKIFLNSIIVNEASSGFSKTYNFNYPYPITNAGESKLIDEYRNTLPGESWAFTFNGQSLETGYGFQVTNSITIY